MALPLLLLSCLLALLVPAQAQAPAAPSPTPNAGPSPTPSSSPYPSLSPLMKKVAGGSNKKPFTNELKSKGALFKDLFNWFNAVSKNVRERRKKSDGSECTLRGQPWIDGAIVYMTDRGLKAPDKSCATRTEHQHSELRRVVKLIKRTNEALDRAGESVLNKYEDIRVLMNNARKAYTYENIRYSRDAQHCKLNYISAVRNGQKNKWYVMAAITSVDVNHGGERLRLVEHVATDFSEPLSMKLAKKKDRDAAILAKEPINRVARSTYTTAFATLFGRGQISRILPMDFDDNRALTSALDANFLRVDQASDATTPANFAILILPLLMSFIPVALIADVSDTATFFYVLLTDVFSAVPFVIKGVELVITGTTRQLNSETWLVGEDTSMQIAETWVAECNPQPFYRTQGIIVICVGLSAIVFGILLEHFARKWMNLRRLKGEQPEPFGPALLRMDAHMLVSPINYDDAMSPNAAADVEPPPPAAGPISGRVTKLFSGLLHRNALHRRTGRTAANMELLQTPDSEYSRAGVGAVPPASLGVRVASQGPRGAEYDEEV